MEGQSGEPQKMNTHVSITVPEEYPRGPRGWLMRMRNRNWRKVGENMKENLLLILLLGSVILGAAIGFGVRSVYGHMSKRDTMYLQFPGEILMRMLQMLILPLVISSLIAGIAGLDASTCGKMGLRTIAYFATTTMSAVILGIIMTFIMRPGANSGKTDIPRYGAAAQINAADTFLDLIR
ncbi:Excitatory amino acid transporter 3 [Mactra antiquata]